MNQEKPAGLPPLLYHAHRQTYLEDIPFWLKMAARHGDPILELGCGTGRTLIPLAREGHLVYGLDIHFGMLRALIQNQLPGSKIQFQVIQADASAFRFVQQFSLVMMTCNTYSTFGDLKRQAILRLVSEHLSTGGAFVVSVPNPVIMGNLSTRGEAELDEVIQHPATGNPVQVINSWERNSQVINLKWHYDHIFPDGTVERVTVKIDHHIVDTDVYCAEILRAGMSLSNVFGDFDFSEYRPDSTYLILVGTKI